MIVAPKATLVYFHPRPVIYPSVDLSLDDSGSSFIPIGVFMGATLFILQTR